MKDKNTSAAGGVPMRKVHSLVMVLVVVLSVLLLLVSRLVIVGFQALQSDTRDYISWQQDASEMQEGSDYLTRQARSFAYTGQRQYLNNYFTESTVTRRRDNALADMKEAVGAEDPSYRSLTSAMVRSVSLMEDEYYSMRLTVEAEGYPLEEFPMEVRQVILSREDKAMTPEEQADKALAILFSDEYLSAKDAIANDVDDCLSKILTRITQRQEASAQELLSRIRLQTVLIDMLVISVLTGTILTFRLIYRPLHQGMAFVQNDQPIPLTGAKEVRRMAGAYNDMLAETSKRKDALRFEATHDSLTGLYNRKAYEEIFRSVDKTAIALLLIDADRFKAINDNYGHETGDAILAKIAEALRGSFRADDYICRIGGDEFAIIMTNATSLLRDLVEEKLRRINDGLLSPDDGLPPISLSVGVAFGDRQSDPDLIFRDADEALYRVKGGNRCGCAFAE